MADVTPAYVPADGDVFNPDSWNRDLDSATAAESIYGELNGRLSDANFAAAARIRPEHPKPLETFRWRADSLSTTCDYFQDAFNKQDATTDDPATGVDPFVAIAGCSTRMYLPYNCSIVVYQVSCFYSVFQMRERAELSGLETRSGPLSQLKMYIDGTGLQYTQRRTPRTYWPMQIAGAAVSSDPPVARENWLTQQYNIAHIVYPGATDASRAQAGWHQVDLRIFVPPSAGYEAFAPPYKPAQINIEYPIKHRVRVGIRAARILAML